jgi:hypothetical protein
MRIDDSNLAAANFNFQIFFSLSPQKVRAEETRTAWAVFKYCGTKTVTLRIRKQI